jgi:ABC-type bacteriocin/lantibiotic exporter with double-glycine peptidase domain
MKKIFLAFKSFPHILSKKQNEEEILEDIKNMSGKTKILISHNLKVFKYCDEVYELKNKTLIRTQL